MVVIEKNTLFLARISLHLGNIGIHHDLLRGQLHQLVAVRRGLVQNLASLFGIDGHFLTLLLDLLRQRSRLDLLNLEGSPIANLDETVGLETLATNDTSNDCGLGLGIGAFLSVLDAVELLLFRVEVSDEGSERSQNALSLFCGLDLVKTLNNGEESGHALALDTAQDQLSKFVNLNTGGQDDNNEIGHSGGIKTGVQVSLDRNVLKLLLESIDRHSVVAAISVVFDIDAAVQLLDRGVEVGASAKRNKSDMSRSAILSSENQCILDLFLVLIQTSLLGLVAPVELGHDLLMGGLSVSLFVRNSTYQNVRTAIPVEQYRKEGSLPFARSLNSCLEAARDLKDLWVTFVVGLWE
ncbi:hypothetical protein HG531_000239 [Fusarium graminearum]|nr:hypothetical protein HG531_000239 [Fusarium graminearum]